MKEFNFATKFNLSKKDMNKHFQEKHAEKSKNIRFSPI